MVGSRPCDMMMSWSRCGITVPGAALNTWQHRFPHPLKPIPRLCSGGQASPAGSLRHVRLWVASLAGSSPTRKCLLLEAPGGAVPPPRFSRAPPPVGPQLGTPKAPLTAHQASPGCRAGPGPLANTCLPATRARAAREGPSRRPWVLCQKDHRRWRDSIPTDRRPLTGSLC